MSVVESSPELDVLESLDTEKVCEFNSNSCGKPAVALLKLEGLCLCQIQSCKAHLAFARRQIALYQIGAIPGMQCGICEAFTIQPSPLELIELPFSS